MTVKTTYIITVDGPASAGKGTLCRRLGDTFDFPVLDTGLLWRAVGHITRQIGSIHNESDALHAAEALYGQLESGLLQNPDLRSPAGSEGASVVAAYPSVRQALFDVQRRFALHPPDGKKGVIMDGRDMGTVICPDADVKFYLTASAEIRAERRAREMHGEHWKDHFDTLLDQTRQRDRRDTERTVSPLKPAMDALIIDTSHMDADAVFDFAMSFAKRKISI
jgi:cytidylate kinase